LVKEPKKEALGGHQKNPKERSKPKGGKGKGKPEPTLVPVFDVKLCISRDAVRTVLEGRKQRLRRAGASASATQEERCALFNVQGAPNFLGRQGWSR
jgi:hypothetical protein